MKKNYYFVVSIQAENECDLIPYAKDIASELKEIVSIRECGTQRKIVDVTPSGYLLLPTKDKRKKQESKE